jgi:hypothetical protein
MRTLLSGVFRLAFLAVFTFAFVVLFEHGPFRFSEGVKTEWNALVFFVGSSFFKRDHTQAAQRSGTPAQAPVARASPLKGGPAGKGTNRPMQATPAPNN